MESVSVEMVVAPPIPITIADQLPESGAKLPCSEESKGNNSLSLSAPVVIPPPPLLATPLPPTVSVSILSQQPPATASLLPPTPPSAPTTTLATTVTSSTMTSSSMTSSTTITKPDAGTTTNISNVVAQIITSSAPVLQGAGNIPPTVPSLFQPVSVSAANTTSIFNSLLENLVKLREGSSLPRVSVVPTTSTTASTVAAPVVPATSSQKEVSRESPPSLHANEVMMAESDDEADKEVEEMDTKNSLPSGSDATAVSNTGISSTPSTTPTPALPSIMTSTTTTIADSASIVAGRSDSASPFDGDNDSFASFVAREVHETASTLVEDDRSSISKSPSPAPMAASSQSSSNSLQLHSLLLGANRAGGSSSHQAIVRQFGVTASCPPAPVQLPPGTPPAPLDMSSHNFPKRSKYAHRAAISAMHPYHRTRGGGANVAKTLDLMKAVLQSSFNMEMKRLCDDYLNIFTLAADNIRENTGDNVPEATLKLLVCKMMEEAHQGYMNGKWEFPSGKLPNNEKVSKPKGTPMSTKKIKAKPERGESKYGPSKRTRKPPADRHSEKSTGWRWGMDKKRLDPIKWEPEKLTMEIDFVLGVNVNKALGHAANRGKVYYLHPELFKYACDGDDKTWLYENKFLPVHGGKAFLMIYTEVESLVTSDDLYKDNNEISIAVGKLQRFNVPQFMVDKMKNFMTSVQGYFAQEAKDANAASAKS